LEVFFVAKVVHFDVQGVDPEGLISFYGKAFGWKFNNCQPPGAEPYWLIETGPKKEKGIGGGLSRKGQGPAVNTIGIADIDKAMEKIRQNGGKINGEKCHMPGVGWLAYFEDPQGNVWGLIQEEKKK
jgi:hypothetical protein